MPLKYHGNCWVPTDNRVGKCLDITDSKLENITGRVFYGKGLMSAANMGDGYGISEIELDITGSPTGHSAAASAWVNINAGTVPAGNYVCARNDGIYEESAATITNAKLVFGSRMHKITSDTDGLCFPWSVNTNNTAITALIDCNNLSDLGVTATGKSTQSTYLPICRDAAGNLRYVLLYA
jgi:hypothetical protein